MINAQSIEKYPIILLTLLLSLTLSSCYQLEEGCLDGDATNFDVEADTPCSDCCNYPTLQLSFLHKLRDTSTTNLAYQTPYQLDNQQLIVFEQIRFYLSNLTLIKTDGTTVTTEETLTLKFLENGDTTTQTIIDNFALVDASSVLSHTIGTLRSKENFSGIQLVLGIELPTNQAIPSEVDSSHPLHEDNEMHYSTIDSGYIFHQLIFYTDTTAIDTIPRTVNIGGINQLKQINIQEPFTLQQGASTRIVLRINYLDWFNGIDIKQDDIADFSSKLLDNISSSLSLEEVQTSF